MADTKDLDYSALLTVGAVMVVAGIAVGTFYVAPMLAKRKAKKLAAIKKPQIQNNKA
ncbi:hypothetical protein [Aquimarina macrocephali]|uniref:hypothetical protein n=1 Tax=Aquimarina macrocephali TaxID=666563 RepID=UPI0004BBC0D1|nr:hypothetical protein [Aquimarina macrocephali]